MHRYAHLNVYIAALSPRVGAPSGQETRISAVDILEDGETFLLVDLEALTNYCISLYRKAQIQQLAVRMDDPSSICVFRIRGSCGSSTFVVRIAWTCLCRIRSRYTSSGF